MKNRVLLLIFTLLFSHCSEDHSKKTREKQLNKANNLFSPPQKKSESLKDIKPFTPQETTSVQNAKKHRRQLTRRSSLSMPVKQRTADSLFLQRLQRLRAEDIELDLNEPKSKEYLFSPVENGTFQSMITLSKERLLCINFDNDIMNNTDRFYTNGIRFDFISPVIQAFPLSYLMVPYWRSGINYYGISLVQNMYTPSTTKAGGILEGDRPYAAYLYLGTFKISNDQKNNFRQTSEFDLGIIGPSSFGDFVQKSFHNSVPTNSEPLGWEYQIRNDVILNYDVVLEKGLINRRNIELNVSGSGCLGTLYTNVSGGFTFRAGLVNPYFANLGISKRSTLTQRKLHLTQFLFYAKPTIRLVGYDATLQGGLFNQTSPITIPSGDIQRVVFEGSAGLTFTYCGIGISLEQFLLSPEFHNGWWHKWVHISFLFSM